MATPLEVNDTSPTIFYAPNGNNFSSPNPSAGWNPYYSLSGYNNAPGEIGNGISSHITSLNGALLTIRWHGAASIKLFGNVTNANCTITMDGAPQPVDLQPPIANSSTGLLASAQSSQDGPHNITLTAVTPAIQDPQDSSMVVFAGAEITPSNISSSDISSPQIIDDKSVAFRGQWSFQVDSGVAFHRSLSTGDSSQAEFNGTSITLHGLTSPDSGTYNVTLDNQTSTFSATSSFTLDDSLLFLATGLDPQFMHQIYVVNAGGGSLSLRTDGFRINFPGPPMLSPTPTPTPSPATGNELASPPTTFPKGSIAAFVLAGLLTCFLLSGAMFYCLFYRPRQRRRKQEKLEGHREDREAGLILNIGPGIDHDPEISVVGENPDRRSSGKTGFVRWKREVEGGLGSFSLKGLGLAFRHSDSIKTEQYVEPEGDEKNLPDSPLSTKSSKMTTSSKRARAKRKGKKRQATQLSLSPSFTLDLPLHARSSSDAKSNSSRNQAPKPPPTPSSGFTSLSYISIPAAIASKYRSASNNNSRSNTNTNSNSTSTPQSIPQSVSQSAQTPPASKHRAAHGSRSFLLDYADPVPAPTSETTMTDNGHDAPQTTSPPSSRPLSQDDWGSTAESGGGEDSVLGPTSAQYAVRSLGPRTSEALAKKEAPVPTKPRPLPEIPKQLPSPEAPANPPQAPETMTSQGLWAQPPHSSVSDSSPMLSVGDSSPFRVDFDAASISQQRLSNTVAIGAAAEKLARLSGISHVRFESTETSSGEGSRSEESKPVEPKRTSATRGPRSSLPRIPRSSFRLTPLTIPPPVVDSDSASTSYVDFGVSPEPSTRGHSEHGSSSSEGASSQGSRRGARAAQKRKTMSTLESVYSDSHSIPAPPLPSDIPPFTVSILPPTRRPTTEEGSEHTHSHSRQSLPPQVQHKRSRLHIHPLGPSDLLTNTSPTDSVPLSIRSDLYFKHSDSEEAAESNSGEGSAPHLPPHPPLPDFEGGDPESSSPTVHSYIVQRVLGTHTPSPRMTGMGRERTGSGGLDKDRTP